MESSDPRYFEWTNKCAKFIQNEVAPRCTKLNIKIREFPIPPSVCGQFMEWEIEGKLVRKDTRILLDDLCGIEKKKGDK